MKQLPRTLSSNNSCFIIWLVNLDLCIVRLFITLCLCATFQVGFTPLPSPLIKDGRHFLLHPWKIMRIRGVSDSSEYGGKVKPPLYKILYCKPRYRYLDLQYGVWLRKKRFDWASKCRTFIFSRKSRFILSVHDWIHSVSSWSIIQLLQRKNTNESLLRSESSLLVKLLQNLSSLLRSDFPIHRRKALIVS